MSDFLLFLLVVAIIVLAIRLHQLSRRLVEYRWTGSKKLDGAVEIFERRLALLTARVWALENQGAPTNAAEPDAKAQPVEPAPETSTPVLDETPPAWEPVVQMPAAPVSEDEAPAEPEAETKPSREWESLVGGSLLNKAGVLITVIGIALFLGYSFTQLSPGGRIGLAAVVSVCMLVAGVVMEPRPRYTVFARGLIGGGWAAIYSTAYAAHGVDAARVIYDPITATVLLALVSAACILHSLRYRSETVTGLGYFVAFVTLAITPLTTFAMVALVPLAASLLYLSFRFSWTAIALPGLAATYGLYFAHAAGSPEGSLWAGQSLLLVYWLLFEGFDIIAARANRNSLFPEAALFSANAVGFLGLSWLQWHATQPDTICVCSIVATVAYLGSVFARILLSDRYEKALAVAAGVGAVAIFQGLDGFAVTYALLAEAELLLLAGLLFRQTFLPRLSDAVFVLGLGKLVFADILDVASIGFAGFTWHSWTPVAVFAVVLLYVNRGLAPLRHVYCYVATAIVVLVLGFELPPAWIGVGWLVFSGVLFEVGIFGRLADFRYQASAVGAASLAPLAIVNIIGLGIDSSTLPWEPQLIAVGLLAFAALRLDRLDDGGGEEHLLGHAREIAAYAVAGMSTALLWNVLPASAVAVGWAALGLALLSQSRLTSGPGPRLRSYSLAMLAFLRCWAVNLDAPDPLLQAPARILLAVGVIAAFYAAAMLCPRPDTLPPVTGWRSQVEALGRPGYSSLASALLVLLLSYEVSGSLLTVAWGLQGVALLTAGFLLRERSLRLPGLFLLVGCILKLFLYDLRNLETPARIASFLVLGAILIGVSWVYTRYRERLSKLL